MIVVASVENMRKSDRHTIENKIPSRQLMYDAGMGVYGSVSWHGKILVVCGKGNNAGDGYVIGALLKDGGFDVELCLLEESFSSDGKYYFDLCQEKKVAWSVYNSQNFVGYDIIVDCIFGTGFNGVPTGKYKDAIESINKSGAYVVSIDINSGLNGQNGLCTHCVKSNLTVSIGSYKYGHFLNMARDKIGKLVNCPIGIDLLDTPANLLEKEDVKYFLGERESYSHKGSYGYIALIGGSLEYSGAIKLSAISSSAMRSGAGVCKICAPKSICQSLLPYVLESTLYPLSEKEGHIKFVEKEIQGAINNTKAVAFGMGLGKGEDNKAILEYLLKAYEGVLIIDADGLNTLAQLDIELVKNSRARVVLTPHLKELERLSKEKIEQIQLDPVGKAIAYAKKTGAIVLLKGNTTIITDGERTFLSNTGAPGMATAGSGDVLSGIVCALCACYSDTLLATAISAYINGYAGELASKKYGDISMIAGDTAIQVANAISDLTK